MQIEGIPKTCKCITQLLCPRGKESHKKLHWWFTWLKKKTLAKKKLMQRKTVIKIWNHQVIPQGVKQHTAPWAWSLTWQILFSPAHLACRAHLATETFQHAAECCYCSLFKIKDFSGAHNTVGIKLLQFGSSSLERPLYSAFSSWHAADRWWIGVTLHAVKEPASSLSCAPWCHNR